MIDKRTDAALRFRTTLPDAIAIRAVALGQADEHQQKRAIEAILIRLCKKHVDAFTPGAPDVSNFLSGRVSIALEIEQYAVRTPEQLKQLFGKGQNNDAT